MKRIFPVKANKSPFGRHRLAVTQPSAAYQGWRYTTGKIWENIHVYERIKPCQATIVDGLVAENIQDECLHMRLPGSCSIDSLSLASCGEIVSASDDAIYIYSTFLIRIRIIKRLEGVYEGFATSHASSLTAILFTGGCIEHTRERARRK